MPVVSFIGKKGSGKTYIIQKVIQELAKAGITAGYIKECLENNCTQVSIFQNDFTDEPAESCLFSNNVITIRSNKEISLSYIIFKFFSHVDVVLAEGFSTVKNIPKFEVARRETSTDLEGREIPGVRAIISDFSHTFEPHYSFEQPAEIAQFIINSFLRPEEGGCIEVYADGKRLPMKNFVKLALKGTCLGFLESLKLTDNVTIFEIRIKAPPGDNSAI